MVPIDCFRLFFTETFKRNSDHLRNIRTVRRRASNPYMPLFFWIIDTILTNSWCVFRRLRMNEANKRNARLNYHLVIVKALTGCATGVSRRPVQEISNTEHHGIERVIRTRRGNCKVCTGMGKYSKSAFRCRKCNVFLHIQIDSQETCWDTFHKSTQN